MSTLQSFLYKMSGPFRSIIGQILSIPGYSYGSNVLIVNFSLSYSNILMKIYQAFLLASLGASSSIGLQIAIMCLIVCHPWELTLEFFYRFILFSCVFF